MRKRKAKLLTPLAVVSAAVLAVSGGLASADKPSTGGEVHVYEADTALAGNLGTVVLTGAITDSGTDCQGCGGADGLNVLELSKGTFEVNVNDLGTKLAALPVNPVTCSSDGSATAPVSIVPNSIYDTGAYAAISGTVYTSGSTALILPRLANGQCNTNATEYPGVLIARGAGIVSLQVANAHDPTVPKGSSPICAAPQQCPSTIWGLVEATPAGSTMPMQSHPSMSPSRARHRAGDGVPDARGGERRSERCVGFRVVGDVECKRRRRDERDPPWGVLRVGDVMHRRRPLPLDVSGQQRGAGRAVELHQLGGPVDAKSPRAIRSDLSGVSCASANACGGTE